MQAAQSQLELAEHSENQSYDCLGSQNARDCAQKGCPVGWQLRLEACWEESWLLLLLYFSSFPAGCVTEPNLGLLA